MKLTTRGRYGLRALIDLAVHEQDEGVVSAQSIADRQELSESYLEQLLRALKKAGLVESVRGAGGGYRLARKPSDISVGDILRALEGSIDAVSCPAITIDGRDYNIGCSSADLCVTKFVWKQINDAITETVDAIFLNQLMRETRAMMDEGAKGVIPCRN